MKIYGSYHTLFALVILRLHHIHAECSHYYTLLEIDELSIVTPKNFDNPTLLEYPQFNSTQEHKIIQNNLNCYIQLDCDSWASSTDFRPALKISKTESTDTRIEDSHIRNEKLVIDKSSRSDGVTSTEPTSTKGTDVTDEPLSKDEITSTTLYQSTTDDVETTPTLNQGEDDVEITPAPDQDTTDGTETSETPYSSTSTINDIETTTETKDVNAAAQQAEEQKKNTLKTAIIVTSVLGGAALAAVLVAKGIALLQSGTYRFPDPTVAESRV